MQHEIVQVKENVAASNLIPLYEESARIMTICNACRFCEGHCAVFPAMEQRLTFDKETIDYLANLCHQCGACYQHCQYADPHEFNVNVPRVFADVRHQSYATYAWPRQMDWAIRNAGWFTVLTTMLATLLLFLGTTLSANESSEGAGFYTIISHDAMVAMFGTAGLLTLLVWCFSVRGFWLTTSLPAVFGIPVSVYRRALVSILTLKNLDGGHGKGCYETGEVASQMRRIFHHLTMYGFLFCFIATSIGTIYHYGLSAPAPYDWLSAPKLFGVTGGLGLLVGSAGLWWCKQSTEQAITSDDSGSGNSFIGLLFFTSLTGLALPLLKASDYLAMALCLHLGVVLALFLNFAWGKFMHGLYRSIALLASEYEKYVSTHKNTTG